MYFFKKISTSMVIAGVMMASTANAADIEPFNATYTLKADGKSGTATRTLTKSGNTFTYKVNARAAGIATANQSSTFRLVNGKIAPSNASTSYRIAGFGNTHNIKFAASQVVSTYKGKATTLAMTQQAYDDLSLEANIRQELINGKFTGNYPLVRRTSIENARFKKAGTAQITVPAGTYSAVRIDRVHDDKERATSFWLAPSLGYLPIKVSQTNDGKVISMELNKVN